MEMKLVYKLLEKINETGAWFNDIQVKDNEIRVNGEDYLVLDEDGIKEHMENHIRETASYFTTSFLASMTDLPEEVFEGLMENNTAVYKLIEKTCGIEEFIDECLNDDGAGHYLSSYDGGEIELIDGYSAFRN